MIRKLVWIAGLFGVVAVSWAFAYGPLIPWSAVKPGYETLRLGRSEIVFPAGSVLDAAYLKTDEILNEAERFHKLKAHLRLRVVVCRTWEDFGRFCPVVRGRGIGAVTLDTGNVIYMSPRIREKGLDATEFLRHEMSHAVAGQNASFLRLRSMKRHSWLYEGVPVWFGRQKSYVTQTEFLTRARNTDLWPVITFDSNAANPPEIRFSYIAWRNFIDYLTQARGADVFMRFYHAFMRSPDEVEQVFAAEYGKPLHEWVREFAREVDAGQFQPSE